jgi:hypothetical protein
MTSPPMARPAGGTILRFFAPAALIAVTSACGAEPESLAADSPLPELAQLEDGWTAVEPGGRTSCAHGDPFAFFVRPGDPSRLLVYLYGGGACYDAEGCAEGSDIYFQRIEPWMHPDGQRGILDLGQPDNPFRDHTMVAVPVCTGDTHLGDRDEVYMLQEGDGSTREFTIRHRGQVNVDSALEWIHQNVPEPREIFVGGTSAGGIAVPFYASRLAQAHPNARVTGLGDGAGAFSMKVDSVRLGPEDNPARWGVPEVLHRHPGWEAFPEEAGVQDLYMIAARAAPDLRLYQVDHAYDHRQVFRLRLMGHPDPDILEILRAHRAEIQAEVPAFQSFILGGDVHGVLPGDAFYRIRVGNVGLRDWTAAIAAGEEVPDVECAECSHPEFLFDEDDVRIVERALELLADDARWEPNDPGGTCPTEASAFSLRCALGAAARELTGDFPSGSEAFAIDLQYALSAFGGRMIGFNNHPDTTAGDVRSLLEEVLERARGSVR